MLKGNTLRIAVCDDVEEECAAIVCMTERILREEGIVHSITAYNSAELLMSDIKNTSPYHLLLLDVMMDTVDGISLAAQLRAWGDKSQIVFISSNREMAMRGYEVNAVRYLAKPMEEEKLKEALLYCHRIWQAKREIAIPTEQGLYRTSLADIIYAEAYDRGTRFVFAGHVLETRMKYSEAEMLLPKSEFLQCHRSFIVNLAWTVYIRHYEFVLKNGNTVPIGKGRYNECQSRFLQYITG